MNDSKATHIYPIFDRMLGRADKEELLHQHGLMIWFTGLSGSGKVPSPSLWSVNSNSAGCCAVSSTETTSAAASTTIWASRPKTG